MAILGTLCGSFSCTSIFSSYLISFTNDVTGNLWLSLFSLVLVLYVIMLYVGLPNTLSLIIIYPIFLVAAFLTSGWLPFIGITIFYVIFFIAKALW